MAEMENEVAELRAKVAELERELAERKSHIAQMVDRSIKGDKIRDLVQALMQEVESEPEDEPKPKKARKTTAFFVYDREGHKVFFFKDVPCSNDTSEWWEANNIEAVTGYDFFNDEEMAYGEIREDQEFFDIVKSEYDDMVRDEFEGQEPKIIHVETPDAGWYRKKITTYLF